MTRVYLVANSVGGGCFSPREFKPLGLFTDINDAKKFTFTQTNYHDIFIYIITSEPYIEGADNYLEHERKFITKGVQYSSGLSQEDYDNNQEFWFVVSSHSVDMGDLQSFYPEYYMKLHGVLTSLEKAQQLKQLLFDQDTTQYKLLQDYAICSTFKNPVIGVPIMVLAQHYDISLSSCTAAKSYKLVVPFTALDVIRTSVLESIYPYLAYTNISLDIEDGDAHVLKMVQEQQLELLNKAAQLIFTARDWNKEGIKSYLSPIVDEEEKQIYFHLIDYPEHRNLFDSRRMYWKIQLVENYINKEAKIHDRLPLESQLQILTLLDELNPITYKKH